MASSKPGAALRGYIALSLVWLLILVVTLLFLRRPSTQPIEILLAPSASPVPGGQPPPATPSATPAPLHIDVAGAVKNPAVYRLTPGSIVADAIAAAGGPAADAQLDRLNKALPLMDGMQVYVPRLGEDLPPAARSPASISGSGAAGGETPAPVSVNINTATPQELDVLPGIGPALAQRIIAGRPYREIEDLLRVAGIGQTIFDKLKPLITVE